MERQMFLLEENGTVVTNGRLVEGLTYEIEKEGMRKKVKLIKEGKVIAFLKSSSILGGSDFYSDYADVATRKICQKVGIKCANNLLVAIEGMPKTPQEIELDREEDIRSEEFIEKLPEALRENARKHRESQKALKSKLKGVISYNYMETDKYKHCQRMSLDEIRSQQLMLGGDAVSPSVNGYMQLINNLQGESTLAKNLGLVGTIDIDPNFKYDLLGLSMLSFTTAQTDLTGLNIDIVFRKTPQGVRAEVGPIFDGGESLGLSSIARSPEWDERDYDDKCSDILNGINNLSPSRLTIKSETSQDDTMAQAQELAAAVYHDPIAKEMFERFKAIDIEDIIDGIDVGEPDFDVVRFALRESFGTRVQMIENCMSALKSPMDNAYMQ